MSVASGALRRAHLDDLDVSDSHPERRWATLRAVFAAQDTGLALITPEGELAVVNAALCALLGLAPESAHQLTAAELMEHLAELVDDPPALLEDRQLLPDPTGAQVCAELVLAGPERVVLRWVAQTLYLEGRPVHLVTCSDITVEAVVRQRIDAKRLAIGPRRRRSSGT